MIKDDYKAIRKGVAIIEDATDSLKRWEYSKVMGAVEQLKGVLSVQEVLNPEWKQEYDNDINSIES